MAKGFKDKFDKGEGIGPDAEDSAPKGHGRHKGRKKKHRKHKGRG